MGRLVIESVVMSRTLHHQLEPKQTKPKKEGEGMENTANQINNQKKKRKI